MAVKLRDILMGEKWCGISGLGCSVGESVHGKSCYPLQKNEQASARCQVG